nr:hypothetical protein [Candidatus Sigynarchaeota archaeon]
MPRKEKSRSPLEVTIDQLEAKSKEGMEEVLRTGGQWEDIGFHRPLGNFFYGIFISVFNAVIGLIFMALVVSLLYPYPEINGYNGIAGSIYSIVFTVFDTGTAFGIERFIAEWRVKDPKRMVKYVQFYIWYQMFTGLPQVTWLSILIISGVRYSNLSYLTWILLIIIQKQYPSMLGIFHEVLNGLQLYNKGQILGLISGQVFQNATNVIFILLGRWVGFTNPAVGEIMGMAIGATIGGYVDDFFAFIVAAKFFDKAMRSFGYTWRDCFRIEFDKGIVKQCLWFGFQVSVVPMISTATSTGVLFMMINSIPSYPTYRALLGWVSGIVGIIDVGNFSLVPSIAESFMNDKKKLAQFYIANSLRWNGFLMMMFTMALLGALPMVIQVILGLPELKYYVVSFVFFFPVLIHKLILPFIAYPDYILVGILRINFYTFSRVFEEAVYLTENWLWMYVFRIQDVFGIWGIVYILAMDRFLCRNIKMIIMWVYIHKKCFKVKLYFYQMLICPAIAGTPVLLFALLWKPLVFDNMVLLFVPMLGTYAVIPPAIITVLIALLVLPAFVFLPLSGFLGGWDDYGLMTFRKAVKLSGPSKPFVNLIYRAVLFGANHSKLHNKFKIPWEEPMQEIRDLMIMKRDHIAKLYQGGKAVGLTKTL